jgi:uncharacterized repeat protein (TIGR01451 family)
VAKVVSNPTPNVGDTVTFTVTLSNNGPDAATNVTVGDALPAGLTLVSASPSQGSYAAGVWTVGTVTPGSPQTLQITATVVSPGVSTNTATVTHSDQFDPDPTNNTASAAVTPAALTLLKTADATAITAVGEPITYTFHVTNTGSVTLSAIAITETDFTGTGTPPSCTPVPNSLAPGDSATCTAIYTVTAADLAADLLANVATASGTKPDGGAVLSPPSGVAIPPVTISLVKEVNGQPEPTPPGVTLEVGQPVTFTYVVTNTSKLPVDTVTITDHPSPGIITCQATTLDPGSSTTCTAPTISAVAGQQTNTAVASAQGTLDGSPVGNPATATDTGNYFGAAPSLTMTKSATPATVTAPGRVITFTFHVTNTGNVTLTNVTVSEGAFSGTGSLSTPTCPGEAASLAPGASVDCTATYTVTQADIDKGSITNTATATGTPPTGVTPPESPPSSATVPVTQNPGMTVVKSANPTIFSGTGTKITYSYNVTNTGNVTLTGVKVTDPMPGLSTITCPGTTLAPAASMTCTATYTTTQADVTHGSIKNVATASGTKPGGGEMTSDPSTVIVPAAPVAPVSPITPVIVPVTG